MPYGIYERKSLSSILFLGVEVYFFIADSIGIDTSSWGTSSLISHQFIYHKEDI